MRNKKRLLIVIPNLGRGGAQKVFWQQMKHLTLDFDVWGCVFNWEGAFEEEKLPNMISLGVPGGRSLLQKIYFFVLRIVRLRELKDRLRIDLTISHLEGADYINLFSQGSDKIVCWIHGTKWFDKNIAGILGWLRKYLLIPFTYRRADQIACVSEGIRLELMTQFKIGNSKLKTVYNSIDISNISKLKEEPLREEILTLMKGNETIITHCRLAIQKNLSGLLNVFSEVKRGFKVKLMILGDGELRNELLAECNSLGLKAFHHWTQMKWNEDYDVYFLGYQANPYSYLSRASLYVMSSNWEGCPLGLCEAMACGVPVMSSDCFTGPREILAPSLQIGHTIVEAHKGEYGILLPLIDARMRNSVKLWSEYIIQVLKNEDLLERYSLAGPIRMSAFDLNEGMTVTQGLIRDLIEDKVPKDHLLTGS